MSKETQQQDVSVLSTAKNGLVYLTANDWTLIADKATRLKFKAGDSLIQEGRRTNGIFLLLSGAASVHIPAREILPALGPGEVCGEISFLDEQPATVRVTAKEPVEAYYLDRPTLESLFELFPHLGSRFYRSLAFRLSRRVRDLIGAPANVAGPAKK
ncbi:MAG TPA: cyclic nucleotide-binding domain-containing protein [Terriglobales bacterium]|nr:cyclic nucleotide-binding domain-containing protein [Terriglobales bacterium]